MSFNRNPPYFFLGKLPIGLPAFVVLLQLAVLVISAAAGFTNWLHLVSANAKLLDGQLWRLVSYWFCIDPSNLLFYLLTLPFVYNTIQALERYWSRKFILLSYLGLIIGLPLLMIFTHGVLRIPMGSAWGAILPTFALSLARTALSPNERVYLPGGIEITLKVLSLIFFGILMINQAELNLRVSFLLLSGFGVWLGVSDGKFSTPAFLKNGRNIQRPETSQPKPAMPAKLGPKAQINPDHPAVERVDALLAKIAESGLDSLSKAERETLNRASKELKAKDNEK